MNSRAGRTSAVGYIKDWLISYVRRRPYLDSGSSTAPLVDVERVIRRRTVTSLVSHFVQSTTVLASWAALAEFSPPQSQNRGAAYVWHMKTTRLYDRDANYSRTPHSILLRPGSTLGREHLPPKPRPCPQIRHETLFDELKASAYRRKKGAFCGLQNMPKCIYSRVSAPHPAGRS